MYALCSYIATLVLMQEDTSLDYTSPPCPSKIMAGEAGPTKWLGKCAAKVIGVKPDQVWQALSDFCNGHEWFPDMHTCRKVEGDDGQAGLIRYCTGLRKSVVKPADGQGEVRVVRTVVWAYERLTVVDPRKMQVSYEVLENNMGLSSYVATMRVVPAAGKGGAGAAGCRIEWDFVCDPIVGSWKSARAYEKFLRFNLLAMARKLEGRFRPIAARI
ncbi:hypothetical protein MLD38_020285 [Melastoma candidum]|uniref:Uncharacterized protein n=1 Tax=Melastoma candidum TaxID=119954 RepID=A0ACB9QCU9_9MYRT|nr:hypothetical protein MLD38_020285 [Melastoma candidum]